MTQVIGSPEAAAQALYEYFLTNAEGGNHAANDDLVAELVRRIRAQQATTGLPMKWNQVVARSSPEVGDWADSD